MAFTLFEPLFEKIDEITATFVSDFSSNVISTMTPFIVLGLTISFIAYGILIMRGGVDMPIFDFLKRSIFIGVVTSVALAGGIYQTHLADVVTTLPDSLSQAFIADSSMASNAASLLDNAAEKGFDVMQDCFEKVGFFGDDSLAYIFLGASIGFCTALLTLIGGAFLIIAKVALSILAGLGPLFLMALLFQPTSRFFEMWVAQVCNYAILIVLLSPVFGFVMTMYTNYASDLAIDGVNNLAYSFGGAGILSGVSILLLLQLPSIAGGLASGVGLSYLWEMRALRGGVGSAIGSRAQFGSGGQVTRAGRGAIGAIGGPAKMGADGTLARSGTGAIGAAGAAGRKASGYFKARRAA